MQNFQPVFGLTGNSVPVPIAAANTSSDGTGVLVNLGTAGANGARLDGAVFRNAQIAPAASSPMVVRLFVSDTSGANFQCVGEENLPTATRSASAKGATVSVLLTPALILKPGQVVACAQSVYAGVQDRNSAVALMQDF